MRFTSGAMTLALALLFTGCATPESRIKRNQALFDAFPPAVQEQVRAGEVHPGYTTNMVRIALGEPDREYVRRTADGTVQLWSYTDHYTQTRRELVNGRFRVRDSRSGQVYSVRDSVWVDVPTYHEFDRLRVEFGDDFTVYAIEEIRR